MGELKIYIDENVDVRVAEGLRKRGVNTFYAVERGNVGMPDEEHFKHAERLQAVIFTHDHHFIEIADALNRKGKDHWGVIFVEMHRLSIGECIRQLALYAEVLPAEEMINRVEFL